MLAPSSNFDTTVKVDADPTGCRRMDMNEVASYNTEIDIINIFSSNITSK
jgi:hypothetical protein